MANLLILGAGGHGKVIAETAMLCKSFENISFLDDRAELKSVISVNVIGRFDDYIKLKQGYDYAFVALGNNQLRKLWIEKLLDFGYKIATIIHPMSSVSDYAKIGYGSCVLSGAVVGPVCDIGIGCIINNNSNIPHDCSIGDYNHISCGAVLGGGVSTKNGTLIGLNSTIINQINIGQNCVIAAGSVVVCDFPDNVLVAGIPAQIKKNTN